jgi:T5orf172 domain
MGSTKRLYVSPEVEKRRLARLFEKRLVRIADAIAEVHPEPRSQTWVMQKYRIRKTEMPVIEQALMARNMVIIDPYPNPVGRNGTSILYHKGVGRWISSEVEEEEIEDEVEEVEVEEEETSASESVYFALAPSINRMKIGWTTGPVVKRMAAINDGSPVDIVIFGAIADRGVAYEKELHTLFGKHRLKGEWFTASEIVRDVVLLPGFSPYVKGMEEFQLARRVIDLNSIRRIGR